MEDLSLQFYKSGQSLFVFEIEMDAVSSMDDIDWKHFFNLVICLDTDT